MIRNRINSCLLLLCLSVISHDLLAVPSVKFEYQAPNDYTRKIFERLSEQEVLSQFEAIVRKNFELGLEIIFEFYSGDSKLFDALGNKIFIPYSYLVELNEGLASKYPQQPQTSQRIFDAALTHILWVEFGRALVSQYAIPLDRSEHVLLDEFAIMMLLNTGVGEDEYILDAAETALLIDDTRSVLGSSGDQESLSDKQRYRLMVCMVLGHDYEPLFENVPDVTWDDQRIKQCEQTVLNSGVAWYNRLRPALSKKSLLHNKYKVLASDLSPSSP